MQSRLRFEKKALFNTDLVEDKAEGIERSEYISGEARLRTIVKGPDVEAKGKKAIGASNSKRMSKQSSDWFTEAGEPGGISLYRDLDVDRFGSFKKRKQRKKKNDWGAFAKCRVKLHFH